MEVEEVETDNPAVSVTVTVEESPPPEDENTEKTQTPMDSVQMQTETLENLQISNDIEIEIDDKELNQDQNQEKLSQKDEEVIEEEEIVVVEVEEQPISAYYWNYDNLQMSENPQCVAKSFKYEFEKGNYLIGCKWSPDGSCLLSNSADGKVRLFNLPEQLCGELDWNSDIDDELCASTGLYPVFAVKAGGLIYDFCWYPKMTSSDPVTSCFLTTSTDSPVHLWDAFTGSLRCSYKSYNHLDECITPYSVSFDSFGERIFCGFKDKVNIFDISRPGREFSTISLKDQKLPDLNQRGIVSSFSFNSCMDVFAIGSYKSTIGIYSNDGKVISILEGQGHHKKGVTHLTFSNDGTKLFSGGRKDSHIVCWDLRQFGGEELFSLEREVTTCQRIYFEVSKNDNYLISGQTNGNCKIWDLSKGTTSTEKEMKEFKASSDCVNGVSLNPFVPILATSTGQRHFFDVDEFDELEDKIFVSSKGSLNQENCIKLWKFV